MRRFTAREQRNGLRRLWRIDPELAERGIDDPEALQAFLEACEDAICLEEAFYPPEGER